MTPLIDLIVAASNKVLSHAMVVFVKRLISRALRALAAVIDDLADSFDRRKKENGIMLSGAERG